MKKNLLFVLVSAAVLCSSCYRIILNKVDALDKSAKLQSAKSANKQIVYIPMHHIGQKSFYDDVTGKMDSLRKDGYVIFFEGVRYDPSIDSLKSDTFFLKIRKMLGVDLKNMSVSGGYIDTANGILFGRKTNAIERYTLVNQPKGAAFYDGNVDIQQDVYLHDLVTDFEKLYGTIPLEECDYKTAFGTKYNCKRFRHKDAMNFILHYRNGYVARAVMAAPQNKVAIVYGAKHFKGIVDSLQSLDASWQKQ